MSNNYYEQEGPTERLDPSMPRPQQPPQEGQGRMVLGNFEEQQRHSQRRPYQYSPQPSQPPQPPSPQQQASQYPNYQQAPQENPARFRPLPPQQTPPANQWNNENNANNANGYPPYQQAGPVATPPASPRKRARRRPGCLVGCLVVLLLACVIGSFAFTTAQRVLAFGSAISTQAPLSTQTGYMNTSDRINLLVMGYGGGTHSGADLTDSMIVVSIIPSTHHTTIISIPRDLWVQVPSNSGHYGKINSVYEVGSNNGQNPKAGGDAAAQKISLITGLDVKYWMTINFQGFRELIDSIGGVDVYVPNSFNACYPKNDDANIDPSWIKVQFNKGMQHMNGETAIRYARAREPLEVCGMGTSQNLAELTDFGRSARQQIIVKAMIAKVKQTSTWPSMFNAMTALQHTIYTNFSFADLAQFALKMDMNDPKTSRVGLSNQNVLQDSQSNDGQYILLPVNNNWQGIVDYIKQHLYA